MGIEQELRRRLRARGYDDAAVAAVPTGGLPTAVYTVVLGAGPGPASWRMQGTAAELHFRIASLPRRPRADRRRDV